MHSNVDIDPHSFIDLFFPRTCAQVYVHNVQILTCPDLFFSIPVIGRIQFCSSSSSPAYHHCLLHCGCVWYMTSKIYLYILSLPCRLLADNHTVIRIHHHRQLLNYMLDNVTRRVSCPCECRTHAMIRGLAYVEHPSNKHKGL